jgi:hypothetical protein
MDHALWSVFGIFVSKPLNRTFWTFAHFMGKFVRFLPITILQGCLPHRINLAGKEINFDY